MDSLDMKLNLQNFSYKNIKTIYIATTFTTIVVYILLLRSIYYFDDIWPFFEGSWPFLVLHGVLIIVGIVLAIKLKEGRVLLWLTAIANLIALCSIGFYFMVAI